MRSTPPTSLLAAVALAVAGVTVGHVPAHAQPQQGPKDNSFWWPETLDLSQLRLNATNSDPRGDFDYATEFEELDLELLKSELAALMKQSVDWWPADYGHYGPFFIRMAWHSAGTYRTLDGRGGAGGGQQRFEPLNSWPDNANLDKARRLLWPVKKKYGRAISWGDLMVLAGTVAMEDMGFQTLGFAGGREDDWQPELVYWGPENRMLDDERYRGEGKERRLKRPLAAVQMGLIYVNPEGPGGNHDPLDAAQDIRETFGRMAMDDEETVALIAGGHTFGKAHGAHEPGDCVGEDPGAAPIEDQGMGWKNKCGEGHGKDTVTSGLEGAWSVNPTAWTTQYLDNLFNFEWVQTKSPAGATQWSPKDPAAANLVPDAHVKGKRHAPIMFTTDLSLKMDPEYRKISKRFQENPKEFEAAFARAWFKLTHRDMGPRARYLGKDVPDQVFAWQDPIPVIDHALIDSEDAALLKEEIRESGLGVSKLVRTAWAAAASYRATDMRGGADGGRLRLAPQKDWDINEPELLAEVLPAYEGIARKFNKKNRKANKRVSVADLIVLGGAAAIEQAAKAGGHDVSVPFRPGRTDASAEQTDVASFAVLEPKDDGFRNHYEAGATRPWPMSPAEAMVYRADLLDLTVPEMTVLVAGMRALGANHGGAAHGVFTDQPGVLSNDFFVNLLDMGTKWAPKDGEPYVYEGRDRSSGEVKWTATEADLVFGSNAELRAVVEDYAYDGAEAVFVQDFVAAWTKVMNLGRFAPR